jgi:uncharacterized protein with HEPN domain|tara:strand:- start:128 stop:637 length:510 start_codon:yes stop_codon:yes gene_type:complete
MSFTPYVATSKRAIAGMAFQSKVFQKLQNSYPGIEFEMVWDFFKEKDPTLSNKELAIIEKKEGDITYIYNEQRYYIECCFAMGTKISRLCEMKRKNFIGKNKWYCYGFAGNDNMIFIHSFVWNEYTSKIDQDDKSCRIVPLKYIFGLRNKITGIQDYMEKLHPDLAEGD